MNKDLKPLIDETVKSRLSLLRYMSDKSDGIQMMLGLMQARFPSDYQMYVANELRSLYAASLEHCKTFAVPAQESKTLNDSWSAFPDSAMSVKDLLSPEGFAFFEHPIRDPGNHFSIGSGLADATAIDAIAWNVIPHDHEGATSFDVAEGEFVLSLLCYTKNSRLGFNPETSPRVFPIISVVWVVGKELTGFGHMWGDDVTPDQAEIWNHNMMLYIKILQSFFAIMRQGLFESSPPPKEIKTDRLKHARKHYKRLNPEIQVIRLRPKKNTSRTTTGASKGKWKLEHRTWTAPHWRWWTYKADGETRPILIQPFVRGPEGAEEHGTEKIFLPPPPLKRKGTND